MGGPDNESTKNPSFPPKPGMSFGNAAGAYSRDAFRVILDSQSETKVRAALKAGQIPRLNVPHALEWLEEQAAPREADKTFTENAYRDREVTAAERSADAAVQSARYAAVAIIISLIALAASLYPLIKGP